MNDLAPVNDHLSHQELFDAFKVQLGRDFQQSNFPSDFVTALEPNYAQIQETIIRQLQRAQKHADSDLMQLLYRVDISEAQLKKYLKESIHDNQLATIAELIIKRVLQKVVIRKYYK